MWHYVLTWHKPTFWPDIGPARAHSRQVPGASSANSRRTRDGRSVTSWRRACIDVRGARYGCRRHALVWSALSGTCERDVTVGPQPRRSQVLQGAERAPSTQNSFPSGSANTVQGCSPWPTSARRAPRANKRSTSTSLSSGRKSRWRRFLIVFSSGTDTNRRPGSRFRAGRISNSSGASFTTTHSSACCHQRPSETGSLASTVVCSHSRLTEPSLRMPLPMPRRRTGPRHVSRGGAR